MRLADIMRGIPEVAVPPAPTAKRPGKLAARSTRADAWLAAIPGAPDGERNSTAYRIAAALVRDFGLPAESAVDALTTWGARCSPPLDRDELERIAANADAYATGAVATPRTPASPADPKINFPFVEYDKHDVARPSKVHVENTAALLAAYNIRVRANVMSHTIEIDVPGFAPDASRAGNLGLVKVVELAERRGLCEKQTIAHVEILATEYHPVRDWILSRPWDGADRFEPLLDTITLTPSADPILCGALIKRYLISCVRAVMPTPPGTKPFTPQGVLVFQGPQGIGKTEWLRSLAPPDTDWIATGRTIDPHDRDSIQQLTRHWQAELGELDGTFRRADIAALKAMVTQSVDIYRAAYARREERIPRRTMMFASVNSVEFLTDDTGNRRWWTVACAAIKWRHGIDVQQLWAQVATWDEGWWLTDDELAALTESNARHEQLDPSVEDMWATWEKTGAARVTLSDIWDAMPGRQYRLRTRRESLAMCAALRAAGVENETKTNGQSTYRVARIMRALRSA